MLFTLKAGPRPLVARLCKGFTHISLAMEGSRSVTVRTLRIGGHNTTVRSVGLDGETVVFVHGLMVSSYAYESIMQQLPVKFRSFAMDLRGHGDSECPDYDATRGLLDFAEDLNELISLHSVEQAHFVGWSLGGGIVMQFAILYPTKVLSLTLEASISPYGLRGSKDKTGTPCWSDFAGSGCGYPHPAFLSSIQNHDMSLDNPFSQVNSWRQVIVRPPFTLPPEIETRLCHESFKLHVSEDFFPGDVLPSENWPGYRPGCKGVLNAVSPAYFNAFSIVKIQPKPSILWIRGDSDLIISDYCPSDPAILGSKGVIQNWPGLGVFPLSL